MARPVIRTFFSILLCFCAIPFTSGVLSNICQAGPQPVRPVGRTAYKCVLEWSNAIRLIEYVDANRWELASALAESVLTTTSPSPPWRLDRDYVSLVLAAPGIDGEPHLIRILVHRGHGSKPFSTEMSGLGKRDRARLYEVFVSRTNSAALASTYAFERVPNEINQKVVSFLKGIDLSSLARQLPPAKSGTHEFQWPQSLELWLIATEIPVPETSAKVTVRSVASAPPTYSEFAAKAILACDAAMNREAIERVAPCAHKVAAAFYDAIFECTECAGDKSIEGHINAVFMNTSLECKSINHDDWASALALRQQLVTLSKPRVVKGEAVFTIHAPHRFGLGLGTGIIVSGTGERVRVEGGRIVRDPTRGPATAALVDWYPTAANAAPSTSQPFRLSLGLLVTPDPGITAQIGVMPLPLGGATINYGIGLSWQRVLRDGYALNDSSTVGLPNPGEVLEVRGRLVHLLGLAFKY